ERLLDIAVLVALFVLLLPFVPIPGWAKSSVLIGGSGMLLLLGVLTVIAMQRARAAALARRWTRHVPQHWQQRFSALASPAVDGLAALGAPKVLVQALTWSVAAWLAGGLVMWATLVAFGLPHSFTIAMLLLVMSAVAVALPSSPGFVGVYHVVVIESLVFVADVSHSAAASYAVTTHILLFAPPVFFGVGYLWREPGTWARLLSLRRSSRRMNRDESVFEEAVLAGESSSAD
ncbi:MAG TPA: lysylphosphatidylglycerol synthase transmembrane domain-containing protein, partial [Thermomicrobiales bacterium]|nr:lysylphosphatidylglycerol synthase transmembrane domain-containing protein [Thermomicrobiales bacterium]